MKATVAVNRAGTPAHAPISWIPVVVFFDSWLFSWLLNRQSLVGFDLFKNLHDPTWPFDFDAWNLVHFSQAEMDAEVTRRGVSAGAGHVVMLISDAHTCADAVAIAFGSGELENDPIVGIGANVFP